MLLLGEAGGSAAFCSLCEVGSGSLLCGGVRMEAGREWRLQSASGENSDCSCRKTARTAEKHRGTAQSGDTDASVEMRNECCLRCPAIGLENSYQIKQ